MDRSIRVKIFLILLLAPAVPSGCTIDYSDPNGNLAITGTVTYNDNPVKMGTIQFLPVTPGNLPATGSIADGQIKGVFTRTEGDGIKPGRYRITIASYDEAYLKSAAKRDANGPDPDEVARSANELKKLIPVRYSNSRDSGLIEDISPTNRTLQLKLVD
jgi:hypothetical protein